MCVVFHSTRNERNEWEVNAGPLSVFKTEGIPITGKVSKSAEMACLLDSEETGTAHIKPENVSTETKSKENFPKEQWVKSDCQRELGCCPQGLTPETVVCKCRGVQMPQDLISRFSEGNMVFRVQSFSIGMKIRVFIHSRHKYRSYEPINNSISCCQGAR